MQDITLVIMAAGQGCRFGGLKQFEPVGPLGETLMEYSIYDALRAGFKRIVFVIKPVMKEHLLYLCNSRLPKNIDISYVYQDLRCCPAGFSSSSGRTKPFGTVHALLSAKPVISGPFAVINADDFYGRSTFQIMFDAIRRLPACGAACMPAYYLGNTLSKNGVVTRGVCNTREGKLIDITERCGIGLATDGTICVEPTDLAGSLTAGAMETGNVRRNLSLKDYASMNFWGFTPWIFDVAEIYFREFLTGLDPNDLYSECVLSQLIDCLIKRGDLSVPVLPTEEQWFGFTYAADKDVVVKNIKQLVLDRVYPSPLFSP